MTESELITLLDAHDALVTACVEARLTLGEFLAAYDDFPAAYEFDGAAGSAEKRDILRIVRKRIAFHSKVRGVLSGLRSGDEHATVMSSEAGRFLPLVGLMRLRQLAARHPDFEAEPEMRLRRWPEAKRAE
jgi:hypothetical protein